MKMILMFDVPIEAADERKAYRKFRKFSLSEGFIMHQFPVYSKLLLDPAISQAMLKRLKSSSPKKGFVTLLTVMEKQFARMVYLGRERDTSVVNSNKRIIYLGEDEDAES